MPIQLIDDHGQEIKPCNVHDKNTQSYLHLENADTYLEAFKVKESQKSFLILFSIAFVVLLIIFSLNFSQGLFSAANLLTLGLLLLLLIGIIVTGRKYNRALLTIGQVHKNSLPCYVDDENSDGAKTGKTQIYTYAGSFW